MYPEFHLFFYHNVKSPSFRFAWDSKHHISMSVIEYFIMKMEHGGGTSQPKDNVKLISNLKGFG